MLSNISLEEAGLIYVFGLVVFVTGIIILATRTTYHEKDRKAFGVAAVLTGLMFMILPTAPVTIPLSSLALRFFFSLMF